MTKIAERIKQLKAESEIRGKNLAREIGVVNSAISMWENQKRIPNAYSIIKLVKYFKVSAQFLLGLEEEYNNIDLSADVDSKEYLLHKRLKLLRLNNNFSQKELGELLQVAGPTVSRWETNVYIPNADDIAKLAQLFDVTADYLLGLED